MLVLTGNAGGSGAVEPLGDFRSNPAGAAIVNASGPIRQIVQGSAAAPRRFLAVAEVVNGAPGRIVQVQRDWQDIDDIIRMCQVRIRVPHQWHGDYLSTVGAVRVGERNLTALAEDIGWDRLESFASQWFDYSEARMAEAIAALPSGSAP